MQTYEFTLHLMPTGLPTDEEFELFERKKLLEKYPEHSDVILRLTRE